MPVEQLPEQTWLLNSPGILALSILLSKINFWSEIFFYSESFHILISPMVEIIGGYLCDSKYSKTNAAIGHDRKKNTPLKKQRIPNVELSESMPNSSPKTKFI